MEEGGRRAQRAEGTATVLAIGTATPENCIYQSDYADYYFRVTKSEHLVHLKDKFKRMCTDYLFELLLIGDSGVGKSCLLLRFVWDGGHGGVAGDFRHGYQFGGGCGGRTPQQERKKGVPWTEEEHKLFLLGLNKYGKGDWRNISRNFVQTRTPTQVASHAKKYFIRLSSGGGKDKRRSSIHNITTVHLTDDP